MFKGLKAEIKKVLRSPLLTIEVVVLLFVPILYAGIFLKGVWDPYGNLSNIKVAVVNQDQPVNYNGTTLNVGQQVVDTIKKDQTFDWQIMSKDDAQQCLRNDKCYMVVTLPSDFSKKAATVTNVNPEQMDLKYETNGSLNYPLETISGSAATQLKSQISEQVTLAYANAILGTIKQTGDQIQTAADGSKQITDGLATADSGVGEMQSQMPTLRSGVQQLANGGKALSNGTNQLATGSAQLVDGTGQLLAGSKQLQNGVSQLVDQTKVSASTLKNSLPQVKQLNDGAHQLAVGINQVNSYQPKLAELSREIQLFHSDIDNISKLTSSASYQQLIQKLSVIDDQEHEALKALGLTDAQIKDLSAKVAELPKTENLPNANKIQNDIKQLSTGLDKLSDGSQQLASGTDQLYNQLSDMSGQLNSKSTLAKLDQLNGGADTLARGITQLSSGAKQLNSGVQQLQGGAGQLSVGLKQLNSQTPTLASGINQLKSGTSQLLDGSQTLTNSLRDGANQIKSTPLSDKTSSQIASPVKASQNKYSNVKNYGHGLAPYFMAVSLFVGCMLFNFAYPVRKIADRKLGWFAWFSSKFIMGAVSATLMAVICGGIMMALGLTVQHPGQFFAILILHSNAMMFLVMFLAVAFDNPGRFVAMIILILSLGAAAGTFPIETSSAFYQWIHPYLPMSYAITGLRESISGGISQTNLAQCFAVLIGVLIVNIAILAFNMFILRKWKGNRAGHSVLDGKDKLLAEM